MKDNKNYKERCEEQLDEWVKGNPIHNKIDDECCPDFSCCKPELLASDEHRKAFKAANDEQRESFLFSFFSSTYKTTAFNGKDEIGKILN